MTKRIILAMCGASGIRYGIAALEGLVTHGIKTHLVMSQWAERLLAEEESIALSEITRQAEAVYSNDDMTAPISSSSFLVDGMVVVPASVKTVAEIAHGYTGSLIARSADNMLKLRRPLIVCIRETPLSGPCLENLTQIVRYGGVVMPCSPGFYHHPKTIEDLVAFMTGKILDSLGIKNQIYHRWPMENA